MELTTLDQYISHNYITNGSKIITKLSELSALINIDMRNVDVMIPANPNMILISLIYGSQYYVSVTVSHMVRGYLDFIASKNDPILRKTVGVEPEFEFDQNFDLVALVFAQCAKHNIMLLSLNPYYEPEDGLKFFNVQPFYAKKTIDHTLPFVFILILDKRPIVLKFDKSNSFATIFELLTMH